MKLRVYDDYNIVYAKRLGSPSRIKLDNKKEVIDFIIDNKNNIDFLSINEATINIDAFLKQKSIERYLKLSVINEI
jgi:hypothetical protein